jgi:Zn-dependent protease with chaperone function
MNFFEHQQVARRKTHVMVLLFVLAVAGVIAAMDIFIAGLVVLFEYWEDPPKERVLATIAGYATSIPADVFVWGAIITFLLILIVSLNEVFRLRAGGRAIAEAFGARQVLPGTKDAKERQLLNVVEEMSIASGVRVPAVYILDGESSINAFAAGFDMSDCIVCVTRGLLDTLNRDELQGVIGHEFSHILNGDMTLNLRMMGVLAGIVFIGSIGLFLIRLGANSDDFRAGVALFVAGLAVCIIGYSGLFFARLIKAAASREREFLADASSVQFTRNPEGIASALDQIRACTQGSRIHHRYAEEVSHMFFGQSINTWLGGLFDTHPSLDERIERVFPGFRPSRRRAASEQEKASTADVLSGMTGEQLTAADRERLAAASQKLFDALPSGLASGLRSAARIATVAAAETGRAVDDSVYSWKPDSREVANLVGAAGDIASARNMFAAIPPELRERTRSAQDACALAVALMLAPKDDVRAEQIAAMQQAGARELASAAAALEPQTRQLAPLLHFPLIDLALPAIKSGDAAQKEIFFKALQAAIYADRRVSPHEFVVLILLRMQVGGRRGAVPVKFKSLEDVRNEALWVLSLIAHAGCSRAPEVERQKEFDAAFAAGAKVMKLENAVPVERTGLSLEAAEAHLSRLRMLAPLRKGMLIQGLFACIVADGKIRIIEAEMMRMVCAVLDCPLPPLFEQPDSISVN